MSCCPGAPTGSSWIPALSAWADYAAVQAYLPAERLAIAVATTKGESTPVGNTAETITNRIAAELAPGHPVPFSEVPLARSSRP